MNQTQHFCKIVKVIIAIASCPPCVHSDDLLFSINEALLHQRDLDISCRSTTNMSCLGTMYLSRKTGEVFFSPARHFVRFGYEPVQLCSEFSPSCPVICMYKYIESRFEGQHLFVRLPSCYKDFYLIL